MRIINGSEGSPKLDTFVLFAKVWFRGIRLGLEGCNRLEDDLVRIHLGQDLVLGNTYE